VDGIFLSDFFSDRIGAHQRYLGPYHMASVLRKRGLEVLVLDFIYSIPEDILDAWINKFVTKNTKFVGISSTFLKADLPPFYPDPLADRMTQVLTKIRTINPEIKIIQGAPLVFYKHPWVDKVFDGPDVENKFLKYLSESFGFNIKADFEFTKEEILFSKSDIILSGETLPMEVSRGCIFSCKFCGFAGRGKKKNDAIKSFSVLKKQIETHHKLFGATNFYLADDTFNESVEKMEAFYEMTQSLSFQPRFICYARLDLIWAYPKMMGLLHASGVRAMVLGIETLNQHAGIIVGKGLGKKRAQEALEKIRKDYPDVYLGSGFIVGLPEESLESCEETNRWLIETKLLDNWVFAPLRIDNVTKDPFKSEFSKNIEKYGYTRVAYSDWSRQGLDSKTCEAKANEMNLENRQNCGPSPWALFNALRIKNFDFLKTLKARDFHQYVDDKKLDDYVKALKLTLKL